MGENRAKILMDGLRKLFGGFLEPFYSTGEARSLPHAGGTHADGQRDHIGQRGIEDYVSAHDPTFRCWRNRPSDPQLEAGDAGAPDGEVGQQSPETRRAVRPPRRPPCLPWDAARVMAGEPGATSGDR